jgi:hypothetical protein
MQTPVTALDRQWARSYARQTLSDLRARETLTLAGAEKCHRLHFLQMAAEKVCKAYLVYANGHENVRKTHSVIARHLPSIARQFYSRSNDNNRIRTWEIGEIKRIAREIELLAPACDDGDTRRDNSEYPWQAADDEVLTPCEYSFPNINDDERQIVRLIKLIRAAAESYTDQPSS